MGEWAKGALQQEAHIDLKSHSPSDTPLSLSSSLLHKAQDEEPKASGRRKRAEDVSDINAPGVAHQELVNCL